MRRRVLADVDRDLLYGMHGLHAHSFVTVAAATIPAKKKLLITFQSYEAEVTDRYHFDYSEHLKVPNLDYGSKTKGESATVELMSRGDDVRRVDGGPVQMPIDP